MDERFYSRPLDVNRISEYPEVQRMITYLFDEMKSSDQIGKSPRKKILKHLKVVVLDLYVAYLSDPLIYLGYSRSPRGYSKGTRLDQLYLGYRPMIRVVDGLESLGYLENHIGFYDQGKQSGYQSRMRATEKLLDLIQNHSVTPFMVEREDEEVIVLRDRDKEDLPYEDTDETRRMRKQLRSFNSFLGEFNLGLSCPQEEVRQIILDRKTNPIDYSRTRVYRKFKYDFSSGGRFYDGWWQEMPKDFRPYIIIDDEPCSELDYSGQHLLLLYAIKGEEYYWLRGVGDPYEIKGLGEKGRDLMKQVVVCCVNAESRQKALLAVRKEINLNYPGFTSASDFINPLIDTTLERHPVLADCFFSTMWKELQYKDSQIAEYVLTDMKARGQLALPVHDSFVVQDQYIAHLYATMKEAYRMLGINSIPDLKLKTGANTDLSQPSFLELGRLMNREKIQQEKELEAVKKLEDLI